VVFLLLILERREVSMSVLVMKYGGTSVGSPEAIHQAAQNTLVQTEKWSEVCVVVSAMSGVTDQLTLGAQSAAAGDPEQYQEILSDLRTSHYQVIDELLPKEYRQELTQRVDSLLDSFAQFCRSILVLGEVTPRALDVVTSLGERILAPLFAAVLSSHGVKSVPVEASNLIVTDDRFQSAVPVMEKTCEQISKKISPLFKSGIVPVVTGFLGATESGVITTLGRGGSDYSAAILGNCLNAEQVWIWTDVDGVMTSDPRLVSDARVLSRLSYGELSELAYFGAKVVHPRTIRPVVAENIPLLVKNTFNPDGQGTMIVPEAEQIPSTVKAVTAIEGLSLVNVEGRGMIGVPGIAARTFAAVASQNASVLMITQASSEQSITFVIKTNTAPRVIEALEKEMELELNRKDIDRIWAQDDVVIVTAVGKGLRKTPGVGARVFNALADALINVIAVAQGSSESSLSLVINKDDLKAAVQKIHSEVILRY
jgi:aspartate kinase